MGVFEAVETAATYPRFDSLMNVGIVAGQRPTAEETLKSEWIDMGVVACNHSCEIKLGGQVSRVCCFSVRSHPP